MKHRYVVTSAYCKLLTKKLEYRGSSTNRRDASDMATRIREAGGRALVHDLETRPDHSRYWEALRSGVGWFIEKGQKSPEWTS